jgi:hypothetical protein
MKAARLLLIVFGVAFKTLQACPGCNIFEYLHETVEMSDNIVVGTVSGYDQAQRVVTVVVDRAIAGGLVKGDVHKFGEVYLDPKNTVGHVAIFNDTKSSGPSFTVLDLALENEVRFLKSKDKRVLDVETALTLICGVSVVSNSYGEDYLRAHTDACGDALVAKGIELIEALHADPPDYWDVHKLRRIMRTFSVVSPKEHAPRVLALAILLLSPEWAPHEPKADQLPWPIWPNSRAWALSEIAMSGRQSDQAGNSAGRRELLAKLQQLCVDQGVMGKPEYITDLVFALHRFDSEPPEMPAGYSDAQRKAWALGIFLVAQEHDWWWARDKAREFYNVVIATGADSELGKKSDERIKTFSKRFGLR